MKRKPSERRTKQTHVEGGSPGLVVMGGDSYSEGRGFESRHHILDRHFFTFICSKNCNSLFEKTKINKKGPGMAHFFKKQVMVFCQTICSLTL